MFDPDRNGTAATARAFATYSLVPYLGILFCPGAVLLGASGVYQSYRRQKADGRASGYLSIAVGIVVLGLQLFLWWLLYQVPAWSRGL